MLIPSRVKHRRVHRLKYEGKAKGNKELHFGDYGLMAKEGAWITNNQIEAARIAMTRYMKRGGKVFINIFPHMPKTAKPLEVRMGSGKGAVDKWVAVVKEGKIMFEISGVPEVVAREALRLASHKLPIKTKFVKKEGYVEDESLAKEFAKLKDVTTEEIEAEFAEHDGTAPVVEVETTEEKEEAKDEETKPEEKSEGGADND